MLTLDLSYNKFTGSLQGAWASTGYFPKLKVGSWETRNPCLPEESPLRGWLPLPTQHPSPVPSLASLRCTLTMCVAELVPLFSRSAWPEAWDTCTPRHGTAVMHAGLRWFPCLLQRLNLRNNPGLTGELCMRLICHCSPSKPRPSPGRAESSGMT